MQSPNMSSNTFFQKHIRTRDYTVLKTTLESNHNYVLGLIPRVLLRAAMTNFWQARPHQWRPYQWHATISILQNIGKPQVLGALPVVAVLLLLYAPHYKPRLVFFFTQISLQLRLILQTIYVPKMEILCFYIREVTNQERVRYI